MAFCRIYLLFQIIQSETCQKFNHLVTRDDGGCVTTIKEIKDVAVSYFQGLLGSLDPRIQSSVPLLADILQCQLNSSDAQLLLADATRDEIKTIILSKRQ